MGVDEKSIEVKWISHRGLTTRATENTRRAFEDAVTAGFQTLETDLHTTSDGVIVLSHDDNLSRVAGLDRNISDTTYDELKTIRLPDGQTIMLFTDFIQAFSDHHWILDIKPDTAYQVVDALEVMVRKDDVRAMLSRQARFLFWNWRSQRYCQARLPDVTFLARKSQCFRAVLSCLCRVSWLGGISAGSTYGAPLQFRGIALLNARVVGALRQRGAGIIAYLPATRDEVRAALSVGVDEIILDFDYEGIGVSVEAKERVLLE
jgi:glycerophosphoryl diester phosphodiesterase